MKSTFSPSVLTLAALLAFTSGGAFAQTATPSPGASGATAPAAPASSHAMPAEKTDASASSSAAGAGGQFITEQKSTQTLATSIIGMSIRNSSSKDAKEIGKVTDLILNQDHQLAGIVVGVGGFLGIGQKDVGIPWDQVKEIVPAAKTAVVKISKEELEKAPAFTTTKEKEEKAKAAQHKAPAAPPNTAPGTPRPAPSSK